MKHFSIEQALFGREGSDAVVAWGQSPGFHADWLAQAEEMVRGFGNRPLGVACPQAVFAHPVERHHVAVVQVADQPDGMLGFHFLVMARSDYEKFLGDPFYLAEKLPAGWQQRGHLTAHSWPCTPVPARTVQEVQQVLQRLKANALAEDAELPHETEAPVAHMTAPGSDVDPNKATLAASPTDQRTVENSESPALLGSTQVLVDGGRVFFQRSGPDPMLMRGLWTLIPASTRCRLWPASFAFSNQLQFDAVVVSRLVDTELEGYTSEEQAIDYPEGRYELNLQIAAESGDQQQLDSLLNRRSFAETWRLGLFLLVMMIVLVLASSFIEWLTPKRISPAEVRLRAAAAASIVGVSGDPITAAAMLHAGRSVTIPHTEETK